MRDEGADTPASARVEAVARRALVALGMLWTLPNTAVGLLLGAVGLAFGARPQWRRQELACVFHAWPWGPGGALTLGNVILHTGADLDVACVTYAHAAGLHVEAPVQLAAHERAHVYQYLVLGPLFLPVYLVCGGIGVRNRFERAADRYAATGRGWWPWPTPPMSVRNADER
ncbi:hypothetical protein [Cognatilysobacter segetis]|uniref:hypothetical protein n=1 Tax=Cognatilysobacter segetis TaxID=2492394 RepID=UPI00105EBCA3|nr:hypothetical protein [Lysobacter segetis]